MKALIILAGSDITKDRLANYLGESTLLIGVDAGCNLLYRYGITPNLMLGDFDSIDADVLTYFKQAKVEISMYPKDKNRTDGELAIIEALKRGADSVVLTGTSHVTETDHMLGNIFLLSKYPPCSMITNREQICCLRNKHHQLQINEGENVSILPLEHSVLSLKGFQYNGTFEVNLGDTTTMRNQLCDSVGNVELKLGKIIIIQGK